MPAATGPTTAVTFYFDPLCPWTWITARWVTEVAATRPLDINWKLFSLRLHNRDNPDYDSLRERLDQQWPALRVIAAAGAQFGGTAVADLYTAIGTLIHHDGDEFVHRLAEAITNAGLPATLLEATTDASWDAAIEASTAEGLALVGADAGIPIIAVDGAETAFFGPVLSPAPTGQEALDLWDAFVALGRFTGLYEIKRTRSDDILMGDRPSPPARAA